MKDSLGKQRLIFLLGLVFIGHFIVDLMLSIWPIYKTMVDLDLAKAGAISGLCALLGEGSQMFFGPLGDRGHYRKIAALGVILTLSSALFSYSSSYYVFFFLFLSTYVGSGAFHPTAVGYVGRMSPPESRRLIISGFVAAGALGMAFGQFIFARVFYLFEGETAILALPAILFGGLLFLPKCAREKDKVVPKHTGGHPSFRDVLAFFKNRDLAFLYVAQVCAQALLWTTIFLLPDVLSSRGYDTWISFGGGHMAFILGFGMVMIPAGYLAQRYNSRMVIISAMGMGTVASAAFLGVPHLPNPLAMSVLFVLGMSIGVVSPLALGLGSVMVPNKPGAISAFLLGMAWCVAECIGPLGGGLLTLLFEDDAPAKSLAIMSAMYVVAFCAMYFFREPTVELATERER